MSRLFLALYLADKTMNAFDLNASVIFVLLWLLVYSKFLLRVAVYFKVRMQLFFCYELQTGFWLFVFRFTGFRNF